MVRVCRPPVPAGKPRPRAPDPSEERPGRRAWGDPHHPHPATYPSPEGAGDGLQRTVTNLARTLTTATGAAGLGHTLPPTAARSSWRWQKRTRGGGRRDASAGGQVDGGSCSRAGHGLAALRYYVSTVELLYCDRDGMHVSPNSQVGHPGSKGWPPFRRATGTRLPCVRKQGMAAGAKWKHTLATSTAAMFDGPGITTPHRAVGGPGQTNSIAGWKDSVTAVAKLWVK